MHVHSIGCHDFGQFGKESPLASSSMDIAVSILPSATFLWKDILFGQPY
jgi:hypothetical protein